MSLTVSLRARLSGAFLLLGGAAVVLLALAVFLGERGRPLVVAGGAGLMGLAWYLGRRAIREIATPIANATLSVRKAVGSGTSPPHLAEAAQAGDIGDLARSLNYLYDSLGDMSRDAKGKEQLQGELAVARRIQSSMLPQKMAAEGLDVAARTIAAEEIGGDYYDVLPTTDGAWIGIGDVAGHGLPAGIIMLTVQSAISALTKQKLDATPKEILAVLNQVIFENVHHRLNVNDYVTLSLIRYFRDGRMVIAGAHEEIIVYRAAEKRCESWPTEGTWIGVINDISPFTDEATYKLEHNDVMVLFTDGVTESTTEKGVPFGFERLMAEVEKVGDQPVSRIAEHIMAAVTTFTHQIQDDISVVVVRYYVADRPRPLTMIEMPVMVTPNG